MNFLQDIKGTVILLPTENANTLLSLEHYKEAVVTYKSLLSLYTYNHLILNNYIWTRHKLKHSDAVNYALHAYILSSVSPEVVIDTLDWLKIHSGSMKNGLQLLETAANFSPNNGYILYHFSIALHKTGQDDRAKSILEHIVESFPTLKGA